MDQKKKIIELQRRMLFFVIDAAQAAIPEKQFRAFKKLTFDYFHNHIQPELHQELGVGPAVQKPQSEVGAVPDDDREGGRHDF